MHSVTVCPCLSETVCAHSFCMRLCCFDMLSHYLSVFVCTCLSETVCALTFCMELHCFDMLTHGLSMSVCPCLSETVCARSSCMQLHCFDMLSHSLSVSVYPCLSETICVLVPSVCDFIVLPRCHVHTTVQAKYCVRIIYIGDHFSVARDGESRKKTSESRTSRRLSSF